MRTFKQLTFNSAESQLTLLKPTHAIHPLPTMRLDFSFPSSFSSSSSSLLLSLSILLSLPSSASASSSPPTQTYTIAYEPLAGATSAATPFATLVSSSSSTSSSSSSSSPSYTLQSFTCAKAPSSAAKQDGGEDAYVRIGLFDPSTKRLFSSSSSSHLQQGNGKSTTLASLSALACGDSSSSSSSAPAVLRVFLDAEGGVRSVSVHAAAAAVAAAAVVGTQQTRADGQGKDAAGGQALRMEIVHPAEAPAVLLNQPVVLNAEGKVEEAPQEKTLMQKYWWVGVAVLVMTLATGGSEK